MVAIHGFPDASFKAGTGVNTTTAIYKAVYLSGDNTVAICQTTTTLSKFIGILQDYANTTGAAVPVRLAGPTKAILQGASMTAGDLVGIKVGTATALGCVAPTTAIVADATAGSALILGKCSVGGVATNNVVEIILNPSFRTAFTSTVSS